MTVDLKRQNMGRGGVQVVSELTFYSDDPSSNPAKVYNFTVKLLLKRTFFIGTTLTFPVVNRMKYRSGP